MISSPGWGLTTTSGCGGRAAEWHRPPRLILVPEGSRNDVQEWFSSKCLSRWSSGGLIIKWMMSMRMVSQPT